MKLLRLYGRRIVYYTLLSVVLSITIVGNAFILNYIANSNQYASHYGVIVGNVLLFILLQTAMYFAHQYYGAKINKEVINEIRISIIEKMNQMSLKELSNQSMNEYVTKLLSLLSLIETELLGSITWGIYLLFQFIGATIAAIYINGMLALATFALSIPIILIPIWFSKKIQQAKRTVIESIEDNNNQILDLLLGIIDWKLFNSGDNIQSRATAYSNKLLQAELDTVKVENTIETLNNLFSNMLYFGVWLVGGYFIFYNRTTVSEIVVFAQLVTNISFPLYQCSGLISRMLGGQVNWQYIAQLLYTNDDKVVPAYPFVETIDTITFDNVSLYSNNGAHSILSNISLQLDTSKKYIVVGESGSGKTSLFYSLLIGKVDYEGAIYVNNQEYRQINPQDVFKNIGFVSQEGHLFNASIRDNVTVFNERYSDDDVIHALKRANLSSLVDNHHLVDSLDKMKGLSGGEKRRIILARALLTEANFLILDELTASIDTKQAIEMEQQLFELSKGMVYITHRFNEVIFNQADEIIIIDNGKIQLRGSYDEEAVKQALKNMSLVEPE